MLLCSIIFVVVCGCVLCHCDCLVSLYGDFPSSCGNSVSLLICFYLFLVALCVFIVILYLFVVTLCPFLFVLLDHYGCFAYLCSYFACLLCLLQSLCGILF